MKKFLLCNLLGLIACLTYGQTQIGQTLFGDFGFDNYGFGTSINGDGTIIAIGAPNYDTNNNGLVRVFEFDGISNLWNQLGSDILGETESDLSGASISLNDNGNILAIGATLNDDNGDTAGHVRIYQFENGSWSQLGQDIDGENEGDTFGSSVRLNNAGTHLVVGANGNDDNNINSGHVRIFQYNTVSNQWEQLGNTIEGEELGEQSGRAVDISNDGEIVAIGASQNDETGSFAGQVRVYTLNTFTNVWEQKGQDLNGEGANDSFGNNISLNANGDILAVGATGNGGGADFAGQVRVFKFNENTNLWDPLGNDLDGSTNGIVFGNSVSLDNSGNIIAVGAPGDVFSSPGSVFIYEFNQGSQTWDQVGQTIEASPSGRFGRSVSISSQGNTVVAGATSAGGINEGAASVFDISGLLNVEEFSKNTLKIFPSIFTKDITIQSSGESLASATIYSLLGQEIQSMVLSKTEQSIALGHLSKGIYMIKITTADNNHTVRRVIKK